MFGFYSGPLFSQEASPQTPSPENKSIDYEGSRPLEFKIEDTSSIKNDPSTLHRLVRKIAVFPLETGKKDIEASERAWWKIREELTNNKRFMVASRQFMLRKDVLQPRFDLEPSGIILLGKILEAHAIIVTQLKNRNLSMVAYDCESGLTLWRNEVQLSASIPPAQQLDGAGIKLIRDFIASIPYQAFQIVDPLIGRPVYEEAKALLAKADSGSNVNVKIGDLVQWITVKNIPPVFQSNNLIVVAEGTVIQAQNGILTIEIKRLKDRSFLQEKSMIRIPSEQQKLKENYAIKEGLKGISPDILLAEMRSAEPESNKNKGVLMTGVTLGSILAIILFAF